MDTPMDTPKNDGRGYNIVDMREGKYLRTLTLGTEDVGEGGKVDDVVFDFYLRIFRTFEIVPATEDMAQEIREVMAKYDNPAGIELTAKPGHGWPVFSSRLFVEVAACERKLSEPEGKLNFITSYVHELEKGGCIANFGELNPEDPSMYDMYWSICLATAARLVLADEANSLVINSLLNEMYKLLVEEFMDAFDSVGTIEGKEKVLANLHNSGIETISSPPTPRTLQ